MKQPPPPQRQSTGQGQSSGKGRSSGQNGEVAALRAAARALLENSAFADAARAILEECRITVGAAAGLVAVRGAAGRGFECAILDPVGLDLGSATALPPPLRRLSLRAAKRGRSVFVNDLAKENATLATAAARAPMQSALLTPIAIAAEVVGLLCLIDKPGGFSAADCDLAEVFAEMAAVAMLHGRTADEAARRARSIADALREATVVLTRSLDREAVLAALLDCVRRLVPYDRASVMLLEEASRISVRAIFDGDRVVRLPAEERTEFAATDHPIVHEILTTGATVLVPDIGAHPGWSLPAERAAEASWMGIPLFARGAVAGLFSLSKREPGYFNDEHVKLAEAISSQASVAVENAVLFEQMQASTASMQALSRRLVEAQEGERRNIARELHDEAGQALASLRFGLRMLESEIDQGASVTGRVTELMQRTDAVIDGLHRLAADLRPASLDHLGLEAALRQYARSAASKFGLTVHFKARGFTSQRLPSVVETALYRVVQEAMANVVRHARASRVDLLVECRGDRVIVMVEDDGVGFEPDQVRRADHLGLLGLRERAEALGGTLTLESSPGAGTTVLVEVASADPHPDR